MTKQDIHVRPMQKRHTKKSSAKRNSSKNTSKISSQTFNKLHRLLALLFELNERILKEPTQPLRLKQYADQRHLPLRSVQRDMAFLIEAGWDIEKKNNTYFLKKPLYMNKIDHIQHALLDLTYELIAPFEKEFLGPYQKDSYAFSYTGGKSNPIFIKMPVVYSERISFSGLRLNELEKAIKNQRRLLINYCSNIKQKKGTSIPQENIFFAPLKICYHQGFWYLIGFVNKSCDQILKFRMDLIKKMVLTDEYFSYEKDINQILKESANMWFDTSQMPLEVVLKITKKAAVYFEKKCWFPKQKIIERNKDGSIMLTCQITDQQEIFPTLLSWLPHIRIIKPISWARQFRQKLEDFLQGK